MNTNYFISNGAGDRNRTGTALSDRRILSPVRLPIPPLRHINKLLYYNTINIIYCQYIFLKINLI